MDVIIVPFLGVLKTVLGLYTWVIMLRIIMSWLVMFGVVNIANHFVQSFNSVLSSLTDPVLIRIQNIIPSFGIIDISPLVLILVLMFISNVIDRMIIKIS